MSSIRPLATITLLAAMGIFLYMKINESPESASSQAPAEWEDAPKFEFGDSTPSGAPIANSAPPPPLETPAESPPPAPLATTPAPAAPPSVAPALPDLPSVTTPVEESTPQSVPLAAPPVDSSAADATDASPVELPESLPPIPELPPLPAATANTEAPSTLAPAPPDVVDSVAPAAAPPPTASPFDAARPAIHAALSQGEFARAHLLVSKWYNESSLMPEEKEEVQSLLNQLAGTVVYSNEHHLEPAYTVQAGETLETIAAQHQVPWQLLAKINGIPTAAAIQPGQSIKVVRGPFTGVVDVSDAELTLTLDGRFAGKFSVQLDGAATGEGEWTVQQKQLDPAYGGATADRKIVLRNRDDAAATVVISSATSATVGTAPPQGFIRIAPEQAEDLYDILSIGSRVVIRR